MDTYECSYCTRPAKYVGGHISEDETDGDLYCEFHINQAPGEYELLDG